MSEDEAFEVGYGKPPKSGRFKKGQSGNPKGRPKRVKNFQTELKEVLSSKVTIKDKGRPKSVSTVQASLMRLKEKALKGDPRALNTLLSYAEQSSQLSDSHSRERELSKLEREIFDRSLLGVVADGSQEPGDE